MYQQVWDKIKKYDTITIFGHIVPDGDCYGSILGLKNLILENFKDKKVYALGSGLPKYFDLVGKMDEVDDEVIKNSLAICLDCANIDRIEDQRCRIAKDRIKIDHHIFVETYGEPDIVDNSFISCTCIIADMIDKLNLKFTKENSLPLFLGLITDSGRFLYQPINPRVYYLASKLTETGIEVKPLYDLLYEVDEKILRFKGYIYSNYKKTENGVVYLTIPKEVVHKYDLDFNTCASLVNSISGIKDCLGWIFFSESDTGSVRVELRSKDVSCQKTAVKFGGGGHLQASGCKLDTLEDHMLVVNDLDIAVKEYKESCLKKN